MAVKIQLRRDTATNWSTNNPTLALGEPAIDTTSLLLKIGDGATAWNSLPYFTTPQLLSTTDSPTFANLTLSGDLTVNGTTTTINSTTLTVDDKNIELASVASPTDTTADGGGITLKGATDKTFNWINATDSWTSSEHIDLVSGKEFKINNVSVLSSTSLGSGVVSSSLTSVGTISSGTWEATDIGLAHGGTGSTLTAISGGVVYSTSTGMAITDSATAGKVLTSNGTSAPTWENPATGSNPFLLSGM